MHASEHSRRFDEVVTRAFHVSTEVPRASIRHSWNIIAEHSFEQVRPRQLSAPGDGLMAKRESVRTEQARRYGHDDAPIRRSVRRSLDSVDPLLAARFRLRPDRPRATSPGPTGDFKIALGRVHGEVVSTVADVVVDPLAPTATAESSFVRGPCTVAELAALEEP